MNLHYALNKNTGDWILPNFHSLPDDVEILVNRLNYQCSENGEGTPWVHETANMQHPGFTQFRTAMSIHIEAAMLRNQSEAPVVVAKNFTGELASDVLNRIENENTIQKNYIKRHLAESATMSSGSESRLPAATPREQAIFNAKLKESLQTATESKMEKQVDPEPIQEVKQESKYASQADTRSAQVDSRIQNLKAKYSKSNQEVSDDHVDDEKISRDDSSQNKGT